LLRVLSFLPPTVSIAMPALYSTSVSVCVRPTRACIRWRSPRSGGVQALRFAAAS
jgi:hypothetical protein